jgi:hypothetical protein
LDSYGEREHIISERGQNYESSKRFLITTRWEPKTLTWKTDKSAEAAEVRDANYWTHKFTLTPPAHRRFLITWGLGVPHLRLVFFHLSSEHLELLTLFVSLSLQKKVEGAVLISWIQASSIPILLFDLWRSVAFSSVSFH